MSNQSWPGVSSLVLNEPLLWEKGRPGRSGGGRFALRPPLTIGDAEFIIIQ